MAYVLDSDMLIQAKDENYPFDVCPGFWDWLDRECGAGRLHSVRAVRDELEKGNDELADWAKTQGDGFFLPVDERTSGAMAAVSGWVQAGDFREDAKRNFLSGADPWIASDLGLKRLATWLAHQVIVLAKYGAQVFKQAYQWRFPSTSPSSTTSRPTSWKTEGCR